MIKFNELRITPDSKYLIIDISVEDSSFYNEVLIDSIIIDTQDTFVPNGPSNSPVFVYTSDKETYDNVYSIPEGDACSPVQTQEDNGYCFIEDGYSGKHIRLIVDEKSIKASLSDNMFFVYIATTGEPSEDAPIEFKKSQPIGTVINLYPLYKKAMLYTKELSNNCSIPKGFVDYILKVKALDLCVKTGNYLEAKKYWNKFFKRNNVSNSIISNCGCYGGNN